MLLKQVRQTIDRYGMLPPGVPVLAALSGGADSVALVRALRALGYPVCAYHLNHCLRGEESERDEAFVRQLCRTLDLPLTVARADAAAAARAAGESIETAARRLRYAGLEQTADAQGCARIATAHTADDDLETLLFHLARGTGTRGLAGIPPVRGRIVRPLIAVTRAEIERYLDTLGQPFVTDSTNASAAYTRNRIRHTVVPVLRTINPAVAQAAHRAAEQLRQDDQTLCALAAAALAAGMHGQTHGCRLGALTAQPPAIRQRMLRQLLTGAGVPDGRLTARHFEQLERLVSGHSDGMADLPAGFTAYREHGALTVRNTPVRPPLPVADGFCGQLWDSTTRLTITSKKSPEVFYNSGNTFFADCGTISFGTLGVRTIRPADRLWLPGARGARALTRLMTDLRIPLSRRRQLAVLFDENGPIAVQQVGIDVRRRADGGPCLEIRFEE